MAYPDDLPTRTDESLGRTKVNTSSFTSTSQQADANEYNRLLDNVVGIAGNLGLPTGSTASSAWRAILGGVGGCQYITTTDTVDENVSAVHVGADAITVTLGDVADGKSRTIMLRVTDAAEAWIDLACTGTGAQFADVEDTTRNTNDGVYLLHGYRVGASLVWLVSRIDASEWEAAVEALDADLSASIASIRGGIDPLFQEVSGADTLDETSGFVYCTGTGYTFTLPDAADITLYRVVRLVYAGTGSITLARGTGGTINGAASDLTITAAPSGTRYVVIWLAGGGGDHRVVQVAEPGEIPVASSTTPAAVGTAAVGVGTTYARADHVHAMPTSGTIALGSASITTSGTFDGRDVSADGATLDAHVGAGGAAHAAATTSVAGFMSAADKTRLEMLDPLATFPSYGTVKGLFQGPGCNDYVRGLNGGGSPFVTSTAGTGAGTTNIASTAGRPGIFALTTGTATTGQSVSRTDYTSVVLGGGVWRYRADFRIPTASDGTDTFSVRCGFADDASAPANGVFWRYTHSENGGNLVISTMASSIETTTNTAVNPVSATGFVTVEFEVNADASSVSFVINGGTPVVHTTNIPTAPLGALAGIVKSAGTTARTVEMDKQGFRPFLTAGV